MTTNTNRFIARTYLIFPNFIFIFLKIDVSSVIKITVTFIVDMKLSLYEISLHSVRVTSNASFVYSRVLQRLVKTYEQIRLVISLDDDSSSLKYTHT